MEISKILTANDTGESGGHQAGFHIPRNCVHFFPGLPVTELNPREIISFKDLDKKQWNLNFIYYNNRRFGGTRDEYRLTGTTKYINRYGLKKGDAITLSREEGNYHISHSKTNTNIEKKPVIRLSNKWKVIRI